MRGIFALLLGSALALNASALPYDTHQNEGYHYTKGNSNLNDNVYSQANQQNVEIDANTQGHAFDGYTKSGYNTGGENHRASNSFGSGSFSENASGLSATASAHAVSGQTNSVHATHNPQGSNVGVGATPGSTQYWWIGKGTPFALGCESPACANNGFDIKKVGAKEAITGGAGSTGNAYAFASTSENSAAAFDGVFKNAYGNSEHGIQNHPTNSHLHTGSQSQAESGAHASANAVATGNPFFHQGSGSVSVPSQVPQVPQVSQSHHVSTAPQQPVFPAPASQVIVPGNNPFLNPGSGSSVLIPAIQHGNTQVIEQSVEQTSQSFHHGHGASGSSGEQSNVHVQVTQRPIQSGFTVSCSGVGKVCVPKDNCVNGYTNAPRHYVHTQAVSQTQHCDVGREICCNVRQPAVAVNVDAEAGTHENQGPLLSEGFNNNHVGVNVAASSQASSGGLFGNTHQPQQPQGGLFGSTSGNDVDLSAGDADSSIGATNVGEYSGYLPPIGSAPSSNIPAFSKPPQEDVPDDLPAPSSNQPTRVIPQAPEFPPQVGCAAALLCVEEEFCNLQGVISPDPVALTSEQLLRRVPLTSCKNPENGVIGKCCRDPNYVDPWPTGNLPADYNGGFDEQGFPTFLNIAKTRPLKNPNKAANSQPNANRIPVPPKTAQPIKISQPIQTIHPANAAPEPKAFPQFSVPPQIQTIGNQIQGIPSQIQNIPNQIQQQLQNILPQLNPFRKTTTTTTTTATPTEQSVADEALDVEPSPSADAINVQIPTTTKSPGGIFANFPQLPSFPNFSNFPTFTNPFLGGKNAYDSASSNQIPVSITPHRPGAQCGLINQVQRPAGLSDVDAAFGEIPWQAMILSTQDRKLLCSGAIVAPNLVLTAAHCTFGLQPEDVSIKSGEWKLGYDLKHEEPLPFEIVKVALIAYHPGYVAGSPGYDLAMLFLEHPVALDQHVDTICIGETPEIKPERKCIATGWGKTVLQVNVAGALMHKIDVDVLPQDVCRDRLDNAENPIDIDDTLVCTKAHKVSNNMCQVDVGGPLACDRGDGIYELTGVYSQDTGCLPTNQVATFALIDTNWVKEVMNSPPFQKPETPIEDQPSRPTTVQLLPARTYNHVHHSDLKHPKEPCDCQQSDLPPNSNQYLPPK